MSLRELNRTVCKSYLVACPETRRAALVDPVRDMVNRYLAVLAYWNLRLDFAIETHTHADHRTGVWDLRDLTDAKVVMHRRAPAPHVDVHVDHDQRLWIGTVEVRVLHTPGHTPDSISLHVGDRVLTGDTLLVRGTGRADFAGGDAGAQYDSITRTLFSLPDDTVVLPAHDYRGHTHSTIGEEKRQNPRVAGRTREQYIELMNGLGLPLPERIQEALQANQSAIEDESLHFPSLAQLAEIRQRTAREVYDGMQRAGAPLLLDVREPDELGDELGHVPGCRSIPLRELPERAEELAAFKDREIVALCRAGVRSTTAAAILTGLGFRHVSNLKGGMLDWNEAGFPVER